MVGERVIAKSDDKTSYDQYRKGDTLILKSNGSFVDYIGENLTRPKGNICIFKKDIKPLDEKHLDKGKKKWIYFMGIPIFYTKE